VGLVLGQLQLLYVNMLCPVLMEVQCLWLIWIYRAVLGDITLQFFYVAYQYL